MADKYTAQRPNDIGTVADIGAAADKYIKSHKNSIRARNNRASEMRAAHIAMEKALDKARAEAVNADKRSPRISGARAFVETINFDNVERKKIEVVRKAKTYKPTWDHPSPRPMSARHRPPSYDKWDFLGCRRMAGLLRNPGPLIGRPDTVRV